MACCTLAFEVHYEILSVALYVKIDIVQNMQKYIGPVASTDLVAYTSSPVYNRLRTQTTSKPLGVSSVISPRLT